jgi:hypothetical protein
VIGDIGHNVLKIVSGTAHATDARVVTIRSAVIWPYFGTVYPKGGIGWVTWVIGSNANILEFSLVNEDTSEFIILMAIAQVPDGIIEEDPGRFQFTLPYGVTGNHFRIIIMALLSATSANRSRRSFKWGHGVALRERLRSALVSIK